MEEAVENVGEVQEVQEVSRNYMEMWHLGRTTLDLPLEVEVPEFHAEGLEIAVVFMAQGDHVGAWQAIHTPEYPSGWVELLPISRWAMLEAISTSWRCVEALEQMKEEIILEREENMDTGEDNLDLQLEWVLLRSLIRVMALLNEDSQLEVKQLGVLENTILRIDHQEVYGN
jgi:hypothetical protein